MIAAKISTKGQIVVPKQIRNQLKVVPGTFVKIEIRKGQIILTPLKKGPLAQLYGKLRKPGILNALESEHADEIRRENRS